MRKRVGKLLGVVIILLLIVVIVKMRPREERYSVSYTDVFDTVTQFSGYAKSQKDFQEEVEVLHQELLRYHQLFDIYHNYLGINNIKTINDEAGKKPVKVDKALFELLKLSKEMYTLTDGKTNIAMGGVLALWHDSRERGMAGIGRASLPNREELEENAKHMDIQNLVLNEEKQTAYIRDKQMRLDVGSIGKGYAVELLGKHAKKRGMKSLLISVGGNVLTIGEKPKGEKWRLGIQDPKDEKAYLCYVETANHCVVTSGDYQRFYVVGDVHYCHIIDPEKLMPPTRFHSVSIVAKKSGMADALSTALFCMSYKKGRALVENLKDVEAMWVQKDGKIRYTDGFKKQMREGRSNER
ncbi:thiamine biosynthesis lipoprotein [Lachnospiraceae bacterium XBB1006]|nr:thiamine biosynthesis lipoprotein [Lachnospiraceae bacterium XBB1006]